MTVDRLRHISGRRRSTDWFAGATKSPDLGNEPTTQNGWLTGGIFHTLDFPGAIFIFCNDIHGALIIHANCAAVDIPRDTHTWVNPSDAPGNIVSRYTVPNSVVPRYLTGGFGKSAHVMDQAAHDFSFTLNPHVASSCGFWSSVGGPFNWLGISRSTLFAGAGKVAQATGEE